MDFCTTCNFKINDPDNVAASGTSCTLGDRYRSEASYPRCPFPIHGHCLQQALVYRNNALAE